MFSSGSSTLFIGVSPLENWRRPPGHPYVNEDYPTGPGITEPLSE